MSLTPGRREAELFEAFREAATNISYVVYETVDGFEVMGVMNAPHQSPTSPADDRSTDRFVVHTVRTNEKSMRYSVSSHLVKGSERPEVTGGIGGVGHGIGTGRSVGVQLEFGRRDDGSFGLIPPPQHSDEGRRLLEAIAEERGWTHATSPAAMTKVAFGVLGVLVPVAAIALFLYFAL